MKKFLTQSAFAAVAIFTAFFVLACDNPATSPDINGPASENQIVIWRELGTESYAPVLARADFIIPTPGAGFWEIYAVRDTTLITEDTAGSDFTISGTAAGDVYSVVLFDEDGEPTESLVQAVAADKIPLAVAEGDRVYAEKIASGTQKLDASKKIVIDTLAADQVYRVTEYAAAVTDHYVVATAAMVSDSNNLEVSSAEASAVVKIELVAGTKKSSAAGVISDLTSGSVVNITERSSSNTNANGVYAVKNGAISTSVNEAYFEVAVISTDKKWYNFN